MKNTLFCILLACLVGLTISQQNQEIVPQQTQNEFDRQNQSDIPVLNNDNDEENLANQDQQIDEQLFINNLISFYSLKQNGGNGLCFVDMVFNCAKNKCSVDYYNSVPTAKQYGDCLNNGCTPFQNYQYRLSRSNYECMYLAEKSNDEKLHIIEPESFYDDDEDSEEYDDGDFEEYDGESEENENDDNFVNQKQQNQNTEDETVNNLINFYNQQQHGENGICFAQMVQSCQNYQQRCIEHLLHQFSCAQNKCLLNFYQSVPTAEQYGDCLKNLCKPVQNYEVQVSEQAQICMQLAEKRNNDLDDEDQNEQNSKKIETESNNQESEVAAENNVQKSSGLLIKSMTITVLLILNLVAL
ncbi:hypothetical protein ABPG74_001924 [Tetrahymena malaccensis]